MNPNPINRYAYTNYTGKPYIYYHGIPVNRNCTPQYNTLTNSHFRTVVRTNQTNDDNNVWAHARVKCQNN